ncbi:MAG: oligosaccharide flippase family protein [Woeseiaceae bacterium]
MAKRVYKDRMLVWSEIDRKMIRKMFIYGMKNNVSGLANVLATQTTGLLLAASAGPATLAVYARPVALFSHVERLISQYAFLLTPMAGSIQGLARGGELKEFFLSSMRSSYAMTIPVVLLLGGYGDVIISIWMGKSYVVPLLAPVLAIGLVLPLSHAAALRILAGVNAHGRIALISLGTTGLTLLLCLIPAYGFGWSELAAAGVVGASLSAGPGLTVIIGACRRFSISMKEYLTEAAAAPLLCNLPLAVIVACSRIVTPHMTFLHAVAWSSLGVLVLAAIYWRVLFSVEMQSKWRGRLGKPYRTVKDGLH